MALHILKTDPDVFFSSREGLKNFEIRFNDRNFSVRDTLLLKETKFSGEQMKNGRALEYTGRTINSEINYILHSGYGLSKGWVILDVSHTKFND